jgi:hypothetical protein
VASRFREGYTEEELIVLVKDLEEIPERRSVGELRIGDLGLGDLPALYELNRRRQEPDPGADQFLEISMRSGYHAFGAYLGDELVGYYWWVDRDNPQPHPDVWKLGRGFELGPEDVYGASLYLLEGARGRNRAGEFLFQVESSLRQRGYRYLWGFVDTDNRAARWLYATRGYRPTRLMTNRRLALFRWRRARPGPDAL